MNTKESTIGNYICPLCHTNFSEKLMFVSKFDSQQIKHKNCGKCSDIIKALMSFRDKRDVMLNSDVYPDYLIRISYDVCSMTHSGYCSDPDEPVGKNSIITHVFPLLKIFKTKHIRLDNTIDINDQKLNYYSIRTPSSCNCNIGKTIHTISSATVIRRSDIITLDD